MRPPGDEPQYSRSAQGHDPGRIAGLGGVVTETLNIPVLIAAALGSIYQIGYCYGYRLDTEIDRQLVLTILELSTADEPDRRQALFQNLNSLARAKADGASAAHSVSLGGVEEDLIEDLAFGAVPFLGDLTSILMDYNFIRRADVSARRVFQERWLIDHQKVEEIYPAPRCQRRSSLEGGIDLAAQLVYLGSYGIAFGLAFPLILMVREAAEFDNPLVRGARQGAKDATRDADRLLFRTRSSMGNSSTNSEPTLELSVSTGG